MALTHVSANQATQALSAQFRSAKDVAMVTVRFLMEKKSVTVTMDG